MLRKLFPLIVLGFMLTYCSKPVLQYNYNFSKVRFQFLDSTGIDYLKVNGISPDSLKLFFYNTNWSDSMPVRLSWNNDDYQHIFSFEGYERMKIFIGNNVIDTINVEYKKYSYILDEKYYHHEMPNRQETRFIKSLLYNGYLLSPPQFDHKGDSVVHRVVVRPDF